VAPVTYTAAEARQQLLDTLGYAVELLAGAIASLTEAYEQLDEHNADVLETRLFRPLQAAYGRAQRAHTAFAERAGMPARSFQAATAPAPSLGARRLIDDAVTGARDADGRLAALQDSMLPVEVGDEELRADLVQVRRLLDGIGTYARELERTLGR